jgi:hypothetical protein
MELRIKIENKIKELELEREEANKWYIEKAKGRPMWAVDNSINTDLSRTHSRIDYVVKILESLL